MHVQLPDENFRRVGQSMAAVSLHRRCKCAVQKRKYLCRRQLSVRFIPSGKRQVHRDPDIRSELDGVDLKKSTSFRDSLTCIITATPAPDFSDGNYEGLMKMAQYLAQNGVTKLCARIYDAAL